MKDQAFRDCPKSGFVRKKVKTMSIAKSFSQWRRYRQTVNELNRMSDHELRDIGIVRGNIPVIVRRGF